MEDVGLYFCSNEFGDIFAYIDPSKLKLYEIETQDSLWGNGCETRSQRRANVTLTKSK